MHLIDKIYINGRFVTPQGHDMFDLHNPASGEVIGQVRLGNESDADAAIAAAKAAFPAFSQTSKKQRQEMLRQLHDVVVGCEEELLAAVVEEYGGPVGVMSQWMAMAANNFTAMAEALEDYQFVRPVKSATVVMTPIGVVGAIIPWNSNSGFITNKLATAIAAGCTTVIKPSEMSALQTDILARALHKAGLPDGVLNIVNGRGDVVGEHMSRHRDIAKISFTGSTAVGKRILRNSAESMKRVTLELGGKSPTVILDDANLAEVMPIAIAAGFMNSGQACIAGTRILVPAHMMKQAEAAAIDAINTVVVDQPTNPKSQLGPLVSQTQYDRVQGYIAKGIAEGATLLTGGLGHPAGLGGYFVRPTLFGDVTNDMTIAREEIFGPVLCLIAYDSDEDAIAIANDTDYGLQACVFSGNDARARTVADRIDAGRVLINGLFHEPQAPFGGFKQSGLGREFGVFGLETHLEAKAIHARP
jgi:aldehyde dehydrogenase (NAD+)